MLPVPKNTAQQAAHATRHEALRPAALSHIEHNPGTGSARYGELCDVPGLRLWFVTRFPYALLYVEYPEHLDVLRVLHQHRDIPAQLAGAL